MKKTKTEIFEIKSISVYNQLVDMNKPLHPLVSIIRFENFPITQNGFSNFSVTDNELKYTLDFYSITIKKECTCKSKYGQTSYDFNEGVMSFTAPNQVIGIDSDFTPPSHGWCLMFHPDFIRNYPLGQKIKDYGFFDYAVNEALILSENEQTAMEGIFKNILQEYNLPIDSFSQDVIVSQLELLLTFSNRYYHRQFITRKTPNTDLLSKVEAVLKDFFAINKIKMNGLPTVTLLGEKLNLSPKYLSDMLRTHTGMTAQQHIHEKLIEQAKEKLSTTNLSVGEIAYDLGFEHPQSFSKLFKSKTSLSPLAFRASFN